VLFLKTADSHNKPYNPEEWDLSRTIGGLSLMRLAVSRNPFDKNNFFIQVIEQAIKYLKEYERGSNDGLHT
jgi:hypothetical protein